MDTTSEIKRLQGCINDLISVLALPAIWSGSEPAQILGTLLDVLLTMLRLEFAYVRLTEVSDAAPIEVVRFVERQNASVQPEQFGQSLNRWLTEESSGSRRIPDPIGQGEVSIACFSLGLQHEGILVTGSRRTNFPTEVERLLLRVATNQAGIGLQEARRSGEQKRIAEMLEGRVADRTKRLTAVNEELRRSEAYLAQAQKLSRTGSFGWKVSIGEIIWSEETFRIFQYDRSMTPTVELILQRVLPEDLPMVKQTIERASSDGRNFELEHRLLMPDGSVKHVHIVAHSLINESGSVEFVGAVMDITERKRNQEALQQSESNLAEAQRLTHTGSWAWQVAERNALYLSDEWYRIYGFDPQQGMPAWEERLQRIHPEDRAKWKGAIDRAIAEKWDYEVESRILLPDGTVKYIHTVGHPILSASGELTKFIGSATDITQRRQAEEALRRSEGYLVQAQRLSQSGSWAWNVRTGARFWSEETFRIFGYEAGKKQPTWSDILARVHPEDRAAIVQRAELETTLKEESEFDWRIVLPDGRIKHLHSVAHPVMDEAGEITEIVGTVIDVTERKRAEALRDGESRILEMIARDAPLEKILENLVRVVEDQFAGLLCSVLLLDDDGQHVRHGAAPSLADAYNAAIDGLLIGPKAGSCGTAMYRGEPVVVTDILQDPLWEAYRDMAAPYGLRACWSTPMVAHSGRVLGSFAMYYREARSPSPAETRASEMATHLAGIAIERKQVREELQRSESYLAEAQRLSHTGSWAFNARRALYWSEENFRIWGFDPQQGLPDRQTMLQRIHSEDRDRVLEYIQQAVREKRDYAVEFRIVLPDGTLKYIHALGHPVSSTSGELVEVVGTQLDVTERRRAEEERERLRQLQGELAHINRVTTMGELTASLAHEVNQPIAAAATDANTCLRWLKRDQPDLEEARAAALRVVKDAARAAEIMTRVRSLFKKEITPRELVDINDIIRGMIELLRSEATRCSISMRSELSEDLPKVMGDRVQLQQVTMNLIINSIDAMKDLEGTREIAITSQRTENEQLQVSVSDTGIGLPSQRADQIFNAFFTTKPHGTGMGLRISRSIVESHGGCLWAAHNSPRGACFAFTLPTKIDQP